MQYDTRPIMAIDVDGVVADVYGHLHDLASTLHGWNCPAPRSWDYAEHSAGERAWVHEQFTNPNFYESMPVIESARTALYALAPTYRLLFVTARAYQNGQNNDTLKGVTLEWLRRKDFPTHTVMFCASEQKAVRVRSLYPDAVLAVDDNPDTALAYWGAGLRSYLVDYPFNRTLADEPNLRRIYTLNEVVGHEGLGVLILPPPIEDYNLAARRILKQAGLL